MVMIPENGLSKALNATLIEQGEGSSSEETIVLAHGYGGDQFAWDKIAPQLAKNFRVILFDWSFSGAVKDEEIFDHDKYSSYDGFADDLICIIEELNLKSSVVFVGHSMSGMIGCVASIKRPDLFSKLILIASSPRYINGDDDDDYKGGFKKSEIDDLISNIESNFHNWAKAFASVVVDSKDPESAEKFAKSLSSMRNEVAVAVAKTVFYSDEREMLTKVTTPCAIVQSDNDAVVPNSVAYYMHQNIGAESTVKTIQSACHFPHLTAPDQLLHVIYSFLGLSS